MYFEIKTQVYANSDPMCGAAICRSASSVSQRARSVLIPGRINLESFKKSSGVIFSAKGSVTAMPGNLDVNVAEDEDLKDGSTRRLNCPV